MKKQIMFIFMAFFSLVLVANPPGEVIKVTETSNIIFLPADIDIDLSQDIQLSHVNVLEFNQVNDVEVEISPGDMFEHNYNRITLKGEAGLNILTNTDKINNLVFTYIAEPTMTNAGNSAYKYKEVRIRGVDATSAII